MARCYPLGSDSPPADVDLLPWDSFDDLVRILTPDFHGHRPDAMQVNEEDEQYADETWGFEDWSDDRVLSPLRLCQGCQCPSEVMYMILYY